MQRILWSNHWMGKLLPVTEGVALQAWIMQQKQLSEKCNHSDAYSSWRRRLHRKASRLSRPRFAIISDELKSIARCKADKCILCSAAKYWENYWELEAIHAAYSISQFSKVTGKILYLRQQTVKFLECARAAAFFPAKRTAISNKCQILRNNSYTQINVLLQSSEANP
jgi:hypothetical protein